MKNIGPVKAFAVVNTHYDSPCIAQIYRCDNPLYAMRHFMNYPHPISVEVVKEDWKNIFAPYNVIIEGTFTPIERSAKRGKASKKPRRKSR